MFHCVVAFSLSTALQRYAGLATACARIYLILIYFVLSTACTAPLLAQDTPNSSEMIVRVRTDLITVPVVVTTTGGRRVADLTQKDFALRDQGRSVEVSYFAAGTERVSVVFALDASGSARDIITQQSETALALLGHLGRNTHAAVIHFGEQPNLVIPFVNDRGRVRAAFRFPALANRRTAIFDAAQAAVQIFRDEAADSSVGTQLERRIVILISDGLDTASTTRAQPVIEQARARGISFYVIHLPIFAPRDGRLQPRSPAKGFRELAQQTGGRYFRVGDAQSALDPRAEYNLTHVFEAVAADLRAQYMLGYYAEHNQSLEPHRSHPVEVSLTVPRNRKLRVHVLRKGYVSSKQ